MGDFDGVDDDVGGLLDDMDEMESNLFGKSFGKQKKQIGAATSAGSNKKAVHFADKPQKKTLSGGLFDDDDDAALDELGFGSGSGDESKKKKRSALEEMLGMGDKQSSEKSSAQQKSTGGTALDLILGKASAREPESQTMQKTSEQSIESLFGPTSRQKTAAGASSGLADLFGPVSRKPPAVTAASASPAHASSKMDSSRLDSMFGGGGGGAERRATSGARRETDDNFFSSQRSRSSSREKEGESSENEETFLGRKDTSLPAITTAPASTASAKPKQEPIKIVEQRESQQSELRIAAAAAQAAQAAQDLAQLESKYQSQREEDQKTIQDCNKRIAELEIKTETLQAENRELRSGSETLRTSHKEEINRLIEANNTRRELIEKQAEAAQNRQLEEIRRLNDHLREAMSQSHDQSSVLETEWRNKISDLTRSHSEEVERLKMHHKKAMEELRNDHEAAVQRLKRTMNEQLEAASSSYEYTKNYKEVVSTIETATKELKMLTSQVASLQDSGSQMKLANLKNGEDRVQHMQQRLERELTDLNFEKTKVHELMVKLESFAREQQSLLEREKWDVAQERSKLLAVQTAFGEEKRRLIERIENERFELNKLKEKFLAEQQDMLGKVLIESDKLAKEKADFIVGREQDAMRLKHEAMLVDERGRQLEVAVRSAQLVQQELDAKREQLLQIENEFVAEKMSLEKERMQMQLERNIIAEDKSRLSRSLLDAELRASDQLVSIQALDRKEAEIESKLRTLQSEEEQFAYLERTLLERQRKLTVERRELNNLRVALTCPSCGRSTQRTEPIANDIEPGQRKPYENSPPISLSRQGSTASRRSQINIDGVL